MKTATRLLSVLALLAVLAGCTTVAPAAQAPAAEQAAAPAANSVVVADVERQPAPAFDFRPAPLPTRGAQSSPADLRLTAC
ncbi:MAG: hypothetical protein H6643_12620 [Caldilineaceae bacterium]|nr:hypothetical protein [Caldilineaceae bacterium]